MAHLSRGYGRYASTYYPVVVDDAMPRKPLWLRPANRPSDVDDDPVSSPPPETVLLDTLAYVDDERDATTADAVTTDGHRIQATFWIAHPPRVSYLTVHCHGLRPDAFPKLPRVLSTEGDLALLCVPGICPRNLLGNERRSAFFIYRAGAGAERQPFLGLLPNPETRFFAAEEVGILSCGATDDDSRFFLAVLRRIPCQHPEPHYIHLFDSKTWAWSTKQVRLESPASCSHTITHKVITVGGRHGSIGWVDLWHGILIYDVVRFIPLPSPSPHADPRGVPRSVRDVVVVDGLIKYFSMYCPGIHATCISGDWHADAWRMKDPWDQKWQHECHFKASDIMVDNPGHCELLPDLPANAGEVKEAILTRLCAGSPALSLHDDDVVYIMAKVRQQDHKAWVLAVSMSTRTVQGVAEFGAERTIGFMFTYTQSGISKRMGIDMEDDHHLLDGSSGHGEEAQWTEVSYKKGKEEL